MILFLGTAFVIVFGFVSLEIEPRQTMNRNKHHGKREKIFLRLCAGSCRLNLKKRQSSLCYENFYFVGLELNSKICTAQAQRNSDV